MTSICFFSAGVPVSEAPPPTQSTFPSVCPLARAATTACTGSPAPHIVTGRAALSSDGTSLPLDRWTGRSRPGGCLTVAGRGHLEDSGTAPDFMPGLFERSSLRSTRYCRGVVEAECPRLSSCPASSLSHLSTVRLSAKQTKQTKSPQINLMTPVREHKPSWKEGKSSNKKNT